MRDVWRIGMWLDVRLSTSEAPPPPDSTLLPTPQAQRWIKWVLEDGPRGRATILEIAEVLEGGSAHHRASIDEALAIVRQGFASGKLKAFAQKHTGGGKGTSPIDPPDIDPPKPEKKTFVAVQLLTDEAEPKPVPFKKYRIVLPDSSVREGQLDQFGRATISDIDPGTCKVSFPDFDAADWKAA